MRDKILGPIAPAIKLFPDRAHEIAAAVSDVAGDDGDFALLAARKRVWWRQRFGMRHRIDDIDRIVIRGDRCEG